MPSRVPARARRPRRAGARAAVAALPARLVPGADDRQLRRRHPRGGPRLPGASAASTATGVVDERTWERLVAMTKTSRPTTSSSTSCTRDRRSSRPVTAATDVRDLQARLVRSPGCSATSPARYDAATVAAVRGFQDKREIPVTGEVDQRTLDRLHAMTYQPTYEQMHNIVPEPGALDPRCTTGPRAVRGQVDQLAALGGRRQGAGDLRRAVRLRRAADPRGRVLGLLRSPATTSRASTTPRCRSRCSSPAARPCTTPPTSRPIGYNGASHGCVNVRDYDGIAWLFDQVADRRQGDRLLVVTADAGSAPAPA